MARRRLITAGRMAPVLLALAAIAAAEVKIISLKDSGATEFNFHDEGKGPHFVLGVAAAAAGRPAPDSRPLSITSNGTRYTCHLPSIDDSDADTRTGELATSPADAGVVPPEKTPGALLDSLGDFCAYRVEDWWTYEVCYKAKARQYHSENGKVTDSYGLGSYDEALSETTTAIVDTDVGGEMRYVKQAYVGGDPCELTGQPRSVEVRYICGRGQTTVLAEVREPRSCTYVFVVATPRLCKHSAFQDRVPSATPIVCYAENGAAAEAAAAAGNSSSSGSSGGVEGEESEAASLLDGNRSKKSELGEAEAAVGGEVAGVVTGSSGKNTTVAAELEDEIEDDEGADGVAVNDLFGGGGLGDEYYDY